MAGRRPSLLRLLFGNVWAYICLLAAGSCLALSAQLLLRRPPFDTEMLSVRLALGVPALFGALAGLYGLIATSILALRKRRLEQFRRQSRLLQRRADDLERKRQDQQQRLDELSTLREVATVVNQESDFRIIAEKTLELVHGLLEPTESTIFLVDEDRDRIEAFGQYAAGKYLDGAKAERQDIPQLDLSEFESHSIVCRIHEGELQAIVPMRFEERTLGVLFLVFPTDSRRADVQTEEFNRLRRRSLLEIAHHISLAVKTKYLHTQAVVDGLTRLYSRSHFNTQIESAIDYATRVGEPFSLVVLDIDHFKKINDRYGHDTGDLVLQRLARRIRDRLRKYDTAYRYGGEEITVLLPRTGLSQALGIAERLRATVEEQRFRGAQNRLIRVTISVGVAQFRVGKDDSATLFRRADEHLYAAKNGGRNQVRPEAA